MPVTVVVGGQYGSEGKGKVAYCLARELNARVAVRVGGPNSGHTVISPSGKAIIFQHLPTAALLPDLTCILPAGSYIDPEILLGEIEISGLSSERLLIDPNAVIITEREREEESSGVLRKSIGSTLSGTGAAVCRRVKRDGSTHLVKDDVRLQKFVKPVSPFMRDCLNQNLRIIIEGTQGYGLSLIHSEFYPYATSRDTTAASFVAEAGLSPLDVDDIVLVLRAFPIRVAGNSGYLPNEIDWSILTKELGSETPIIEYTSVTQLARRIGRFHPDVVSKAIIANAPTRIILNHLDYVDNSYSHLNGASDKIFRFLDEVELSIGRTVDYIGLGPSSIVRCLDVKRKVCLI
ncbi:adenylosuccinate synthetase [Synechococcus sp. PCC 7336]|uniref:adenylosuccinate synthetase n=1 Tax=Synechococcus sp. PCC 7336 TaxID=195250 RepID=UPI000346B9EE|nr:adenylosuccinate synthetase [Synechococcus sp. PCC 7336]